jgi:hypothetical protein
MAVPVRVTPALLALAFTRGRSASEPSTPYGPS